MKTILGVKVTVGEVAAVLHDHAQWLRRTFTAAELTEPGCDTAGGEVRLQVREDGWLILTGDSQYDQDHRGAWGCGFIRRGANWAECRECARDLINDARNDAPEEDDGE